MALQSTIDRINDAIGTLGRAKDQLMTGGEDRARPYDALGFELVRSRRAWLEARIAHRKAVLDNAIASNEVEGERYDLSLTSFNATAEAERSAYLAYEQAVRAFDAAVGCVF